MSFMTGASQSALHAIALLRKWQEPASARSTRRPMAPVRNTFADERDELLAALSDELRGQPVPEVQAVCLRLARHLTALPQRLPS
jgi:hypothetical protein